MNDLDRRRWEHLLLWLRDEHGMDICEGGFPIEARDVEGECTPSSSVLSVEQRAYTGAGRGLFALRDCPVS